MKKILNNTLALSALLASTATTHASAGDLEFTIGGGLGYELYAPVLIQETSANTEAPSETPSVAPSETPSVAPTQNGGLTNVLSKKYSIDKENLKHFAVLNLETAALIGVADSVAIGLSFEASGGIDVKQAIKEEERKFIAGASSSLSMITKYNIADNFALIGKLGAKVNTMVNLGSESFKEELKNNLKAGVKLGLGASFKPMNALSIQFEGFGVASSSVTEIKPELSAGGTLSAFFSI